MIKLFHDKLVRAGDPNENVSGKNEFFEITGVVIIYFAPSWGR